MPKELEDVLKKRVKPLVERAVHKNVGVHITEIEQDISDKLGKPLFEFDVDVSIPFKKAKKNFKRDFLSRVLEVHLGNISDASKAAGIERESMHRLIKELQIQVKRLTVPAQYKKEAVQHIIADTFEHYKGAIAPQRFEKLYAELPTLTKEITKELPRIDWAFERAEKEFEKRYFEKALATFKSVSETAKAVGLRPETLSRKLKALELR
jgi:DNA-binding NtrC family response regulator